MLYATLTTILKTPLEALRSYFSQAALQQVAELEEQLRAAQNLTAESVELRRQVGELERQRSAIVAMARRQAVQLQELRRRLRHREESLTNLRARNQAGSQELQRVREQARLANDQHLAEMRKTLERAQQALEEVRRGKVQLEASRPRRKVLPPRSLWPVAS